MSLRFTRAEARVLLDRINKIAPLQQDQRSSYKELEQVCRKHSPAEVIFAHQLHVLRLPVAKRNLRFHPTRRWELDFAWPRMGMRNGVAFPLGGGLCVEIQGGVHKIGKRFEADMEKFFEAVLARWVVVPVSTADVRSGRAAARVTTLIETFGEDWMII